MPTMKNRGRTVFGVRMGLYNAEEISGCAPAQYHRVLSGAAYCHAFNRCCRKAVSIFRKGIVSHQTCFRTSCSFPE